MDVETKFLRLTKPAALDDRIDGWRVAWVGGWDRCCVLFVVMVEKLCGDGRKARAARSGVGLIWTRGRVCFGRHSGQRRQGPKDENLTPQSRQINSRGDWRGSGASHGHASHR